MNFLTGLFPGWFSRFDKNIFNALPADPKLLIHAAKNHDRPGYNSCRNFTIFRL
jgi:hypothetical protein